jgi:hypothetical protein
MQMCKDYIIPLCLWNAECLKTNFMKSSNLERFPTTKKERLTALERRYLRRVLTNLDCSYCNKPGISYYPPIPYLSHFFYSRNQNPKAGVYKLRTLFYFSFFPSVELLQLLKSSLSTLLKRPPSSPLAIIFIVLLATSCLRRLAYARFIYSYLYHQCKSWIILVESKLTFLVLHAVDVPM